MDIWTNGGTDGQGEINPPDTSLQWHKKYNSKWYLFIGGNLCDCNMKNDNKTLFPTCKSVKHGHLTLGCRTVALKFFFLTVGKN